jgi:hypothetical protein
MPVTFLRFLPLIALVLAWTLPYAVVNHTYPIPTYYAEFTALALYVLVALTVASLAYAMRGRSLSAPIRLPRVAIVPFLFAVLLVVQTFVLRTSQPSMNLLGAGFLLAAMMATHSGFWMNRLGMAETALRWIAYALLAGGAFSVFCQVVQLLHWETHFSPFVVAYGALTERRPFGNMAQANHLATYISFAVAAALYLAQTRRLPVPLWVVLTVVFSTGQALTVSRGPWLQTGVIVLGGFWMAWAGRRAGTRTPASFAHGGRSGLRWLLPLMLLAIFIAVNIAVRWANVHFDLQLAESAADRFKDAGQIAPRIALWNYGITMFRMHPWLGVGWGEFPRLQYELVDALGHVEIANNSHDIFIDLLAKTGVVGVAILAVGLGAWLVRSVRGAGGIERAFGCTLLASLLMHALVEYPQQYMFFLLPAWFVIGLLDTEPLRIVSPRVSQIAQGALVMFGLASLYPVYRDYLRAEVLYYGHNPAAQYQADPSKLFGAWGQYGAATLLSLSTPDIQYKLGMHRQAMTLLPGETVVRRYAILQALAGDTDGALATMRRLKVFSEELHDWPSQLASVYTFCDQRHPQLDAFRQKLLTTFGMPPKSTFDDSESDQDSDE